MRDSHVDELIALEGRINTLEEGFIDPPRQESLQESLQERPMQSNAWAAGELYSGGGGGVLEGTTSYSRMRVAAPAAMEKYLDLVQSAVLQVLFSLYFVVRFLFYSKRKMPFFKDVCGHL